MAKQQDAAVAVATGTAAAAETEAYRAEARDLAVSLARALAAVMDLDLEPAPDWAGLRALALEVRAAADTVIRSVPEGVPGSPDCWVPR